MTFTWKMFIIFAHGGGGGGGGDTSRDKARHSPRLCLCVPQTLRAVQETRKCVGFLLISAEPQEPLSWMK